jgi:hypothetical protein
MKVEEEWEGGDGGRKEMYVINANVCMYGNISEFINLYN